MSKVTQCHQSLNFLHKTVTQVSRVSAIRVIGGIAYKRNQLKVMGKLVAISLTNYQQNISFPEAWAFMRSNKIKILQTHFQPNKQDDDHKNPHSRKT